MGDFTVVVVAYGAVYAAIAGYVLFLDRRMARLSSEIEELKRPKGVSP